MIWSKPDELSHFKSHHRLNQYWNAWFNQNLSSCHVVNPFTGVPVFKCIILSKPDELLHGKSLSHGTRIQMQKVYSSRSGKIRKPVKTCQIVFSSYRQYSIVIMQFSHSGRNRYRITKPQVLKAHSKDICICARTLSQRIAILDNTFSKDILITSSFLKGYDFSILLPFSEDIHIKSSLVEVKGYP